MCKESCVIKSNWGFLSPSEPRLCNPDQTLLTTAVPKQGPDPHISLLLLPHASMFSFPRRKKATSPLNPRVAFLCLFQILGQCEQLQF